MPPDPARDQNFPKAGLTVKCQKTFQCLFISKMKNKEIKSPEGLTALLSWLLYIGLAMSVVAIVSSSLEHQFFMNFSHGLYTSSELATAAAATNDARQINARYGLLASGMVTLLFTLIWMYRANEYARRLGASDMKFSPWSAICWCFVPLANLWKPHQAMKEIWLASYKPGPSWPRGLAAPSIINWWWFLVLLTGFAGIAALATEFSTDSVHALLAADTVENLREANGLERPMFANLFSLGFELLCIPNILVTVSLVRKISEMQLAGYRILREEGKLPDAADDWSRPASGSDSFRESLNPEWVLSGFDENGNIIRFLFSAKSEKLISGGLLLGRDEKASDLVVPSVLVSRRHARISMSEGELCVEDLNSTNGTFVNGSPVLSGTVTRLDNGTKLTLGDIDLAVTRAI